jgi:hypothetical protein
MTFLLFQLVGHVYLILERSLSLDLKNSESLHSVMCCYSDAAAYILNPLKIFLMGMH